MVKMLGVGKLVAEAICGQPSFINPFRFSRYEEGDLHPVSNSPFLGVRIELNISLVNS